MSAYTTQVRYIIDAAVDFDNTLTWKQKIEKACPIIFDFDFPIWNETHKLELEKKILTHYFNYEIGLETVDLWKIYLDEKLNEIMPYYVDMYNAIYPNLDKLYVNRDYKDTSKQTTSKNSVTTDNRTVGTVTENTTDTTGNTSDNKTANTTTQSQSDTTSDTTRDNKVDSDRNENLKLVKDFDGVTDRSGTKTDKSTDKKTENVDETADENGSNHDLTIVSDLPQTTLQNLDYATQSTSADSSYNKHKTDSIDRTINDTFDETETTIEKDTVNNNQTDTGTNNITQTVDTDETINIVGNSKSNGSSNVTDNRTIGTETNIQNNGKSDTTDKRNINNDTDTTTENTFTTYGLNGKTYSELISEYLPVIKNIDMMILKDLKPLFMLIF